VFFAMIYPDISCLIRHIHLAPWTTPRPTDRIRCKKHHQRPAFLQHRIEVWLRRTVNYVLIRAREHTLCS
jgi:hypothetical protein